MSTLILTHADVVRLLDALPLLEALREGFAHHSAHSGPDPQRARAALGGQDAALVIFPGTLPDVPAYSVKVHARFPGVASVRQGVVALFDASSGALLALLDADQLTAIRTGVAAAVSVDVLARPDAAYVTLLGAGRQSSVTLRSLRLVRSLRQVRIYDRDFAAAAALAERTYSALKLPCTPVETIEAALEDADVVLCDTSNREPVLYPGMIPAGAHVVSLGAADPGQQELSANLIRQSRFFTDDRALAQDGPLSQVNVTADQVVELGEVISGRKPGRASPSEITLYAPVGLPSQDLAAAWLVYERAREDEDVLRVELSG